MSGASEPGFGLEAIGEILAFATTTISAGPQPIATDLHIFGLQLMHAAVSAGGQGTQLSGSPLNTRTQAFSSCCTASANWPAVCSAVCVGLRLPAGEPACVASATARAGGAALLRTGLPAGFLKHEIALRPLLDDLWPALCSAISARNTSLAAISGAAQVPQTQA